MSGDHGPLMPAAQIEKGGEERGEKKDEELEKQEMEVKCCGKEEKGKTYKKSTSLEREAYCSHVSKRKKRKTTFQKLSPPTQAGIRPSILTHTLSSLLQALPPQPSADNMHIAAIPSVFESLGLCVCALYIHAFVGL